MTVDLSVLQPSKGGRIRIGENAAESRARVENVTIRAKFFILKRITQRTQPMTLILELSDNKEAALKAKAQAQGLSAEQYAEQVLNRDLVSHNDPASVVDKMRALRAHVKPDPEGWTTRDYVQYGRR
jgi:hypothetical protein